MKDRINRIPFVSTTLSVRWIDAADSGRFGPCLFVGNDPLPYYRMTAVVAAWFHRKMTAAMDRADRGDTDLATALIESGSIDVYWELANWAIEAYGADAIATSSPGLPAIGDWKPPPDDVPPVDAVVWAGAIDGVRVHKSAAAPNHVIAVPNRIDSGRKRSSGQKAKLPGTDTSASLFGA